MAGVAPTRIAQIAVAVEDLERAKSFYGDVLGLDHLFDAPPGLSFFRCGETRLMLSRPEGSASPGSSILYYGVDDVEAAHRTMEGHGVAFEQAPRCIAKVDGRDIWLAVCRDSEGNLIGLMSG
jgi:methylmalonyl-CoA/ethylmalonyl-CoA epimerase